MGSAHITRHPDHEFRKHRHGGAFSLIIKVFDKLGGSCTSAEDLAKQYVEVSPDDVCGQFQLAYEQRFQGVTKDKNCAYCHFSHERQRRSPLFLRPLESF
jgi:hypothetical protein